MWKWASTAQATVQADIYHKYMVSDGWRMIVIKKSPVASYFKVLFTGIQCLYEHALVWQTSASACWLCRLLLRFLCCLLEEVLLLCMITAGAPGTVPHKAQEELPGWFWTPKPLNTSWRVLCTQTARSVSIPAFVSVCLSVAQTHLLPLSTRYSKHRQKEVCPAVKFPLLMQPATGEPRNSATVFLPSRRDTHNVRNFWLSERSRLFFIMPVEWTILWCVLWICGYCLQYCKWRMVPMEYLLVAKE